MGLSELVEPFPWSRYSRKMISRIDCPRWYGIFTEEEASERGMRLVTGFAGEVSAGNAVRFYWLVDVSDGIIADLKYQLFGQSALIGAAEAACEMVAGKNYDQAKRLSTELIDRHVRDKSEVPAFPPETSAHLNLVLWALDEAAEQCLDIPLSDTYVTPLPADADGEFPEGGYPGWMEMEKKQKIAAIEQVLDKDVRPYVAMDAGGVEVLDLLNERELIIAYKGSCTSCVSSIGSTLTQIQQILRHRIHPELVVVPDLQDSSFLRE